MHAQTVQYMKPMFRKLKHKVGGGGLELKKLFSQMPIHGKFIFFSLQFI